VYNLDRERIRAGLHAAEPSPTGDWETKIKGSGSPKPRVLIADNHQPMRSAAANVLGTKCEVEIIGFASDGKQAIDDVFRIKPDILILEITLPVTDGIRVTRVLSNAKTKTRIVILTGIADAAFQRAAMEAGALAYVIKARMLTDLPLAIEAVLEGGTFCSPSKI
jgi:DNA-binding NarL/FixJ family response regulator